MGAAAAAAPLRRGALCHASSKYVQEREQAACRTCIHRSADREIYARARLVSSKSRVRGRRLFHLVRSLRLQLLSLRAVVQVPAWWPRPGSIFFACVAGDNEVCAILSLNLSSGSD